MMYTVEEQKRGWVHFHMMAAEEQTLHIQKMWSDTLKKNSEARMLEFVKKVTRERAMMEVVQMSLEDIKKVVESLKK